MRIDKFLKVSRVIKRRTVANDACDAGRVSINGRPAKASAEVREGDIVEVGFGSGKTRFKVLKVSENVRKEDAGAMYQLLEE
jgi:ribosomal 50S subunit-recycling heat shock protein